MSKTEEIRIYWPKEVDEAIWLFIDSNDQNEKNDIYTKHIHKALTSLIDALINRYRFSGQIGSEIDMDWLRSECYVKFLEIIDKGYLNPDKGRPFNYLTSVLKFHMIAVRKSSHKQKLQMESNYFGNEEFIFNESETEDDYYNNYNPSIDRAISFIEDEEEIDFSAITYHKIMEYLKDDLDNNRFSSTKEGIFAAQLLELMESLHKFTFQNKFFIKFMLRELATTAGCSMKPFTINYYLLKFWKKYLKRMQNELG